LPLNEPLAKVLEIALPGEGRLSETQPIPL
jgi:hypothetical protein